MTNVFLENEAKLLNGDETSDELHLCHGGGRTGCGKGFDGRCGLQKIPDVYSSISVD